MFSAFMQSNCCIVTLF